MAIYRLHAKPIKRKISSPRPGGAERRSAVAAAAYRSGERLWDNTAGKFQEITREADHQIEFTDILAPEGAPSWVFDRAGLWNAVERSETNRDGSLKENALLAREVQLTLPRELPLEETVGLVKEFARRHFISEGMVADIAIHNKPASDGQMQRHAHIMLTTRRLNPEGEAGERAGFYRSKERAWFMPDSLYADINQAKATVDRYQTLERLLGPLASVNDALAHAQGVCERFERGEADAGENNIRLVRARRLAGELKTDCKRLGGDARLGDALDAATARRNELSAQTPLHHWRVSWADMTNDALESVGSDARIDHRTLADQRAEALARGDAVRAAELDREPQKPLGVLGHIERAYDHLRGRIHTWAAVEQRAKMQQAVGWMRLRDPSDAETLVLRLQDWTQEVIDRFARAQERDLVPEVPIGGSDYDR